MTSNELFMRIIEFGIPYENHASDLYIPKTEQNTKLIAVYEFKENVTTFISQIEKTMWYDIPFAYQPYWSRRLIGTG